MQKHGDDQDQIEWAGIAAVHPSASARIHNRSKAGSVALDLLVKKGSHYLLLWATVVTLACDTLRKNALYGFTTANKPIFLLKRSENLSHAHVTVRDVVMTYDE